MKKQLLFFLLLVSLFNCTYNYYEITSENELKIHSLTDSTEIIAIIPKNNNFYISSNVYKNDYKKIKWRNKIGYINYKKINQTPLNNIFNNNNSLKETNQSGEIKVKGYYRKDGTYVRPHTRSRKIK